jgi:hypothetical protein
VTRTQAELVLLVALLVAAWLVVSRSGSLSPSGADQPRPHNANRDESVGGGLSERAEALRAYLATPRPLGPVRRNPFSFPVPFPVGAERGGRVAAAAVRSPDLAPSRPEMALSGIAEEAGTGHLVRTAVMSVRGQLVFAREGDRVLSRFLLVRIAADAVQLKDNETGEVFTLALK